MPSSLAKPPRAIVYGAGLGAEDGEESVRGDDGLKFAALLGRDDALGAGDEGQREIRGGMGSL